MRAESDWRGNVTREQFERAADLAQRDDEYSCRWALVHERMAEAAVRALAGT